MTEIFKTMSKSPPASHLLGWAFKSWNPERNEIEVGFNGKSEFTNPMGVVQGGFLTAMLDDTMGPAVFAMSNGKKICQSIDIHTHFLAPVHPGAITCRARVIKAGRRIAFLEAELFDANGTLCARATSSANMADIPS